MKLLIVEDNKETRKLISFSLDELKLDIIEAESGKEALKKIELDRPSIIILDLGLPDISGKEVCKIIRENVCKYGTPFIIMLTAETEQKSVIEGLSLGADDYIKKPFDTDELFFRVKGIKSRIKDEIEVLKFGNIRLNISTMTCFLDDEKIDIGKKEFELLEYLIENQGLILSREKILDHIWGGEIDIFDRAVDQCVKRLRGKIPPLKEWLKSKKGVGYVLEI